MEKYFKRKFKFESSSSSSHDETDESLKQIHIEKELPDLPTDPGLRTRIIDYDHNIRDQVRRAYLLKGPCQPQNHNFPQRKFGQSLRRFNTSWFNEFGSWLEYSISKDAAFCLCCYLFKVDTGDQGSGDSFVGLSFRGHDKFEHSSNQGNFLELLKFLSDQNEVVRNVVLKNAPANLKLIALNIQKDIVRAAASEATNAIVKELGEGLFSILLDESRDVSMKDQMVVALRYVDRKGNVVERFLGIKHVSSTSVLSLKKAVDDLFSTHGLSISMLRGQGYDGASNMQGEFNGLKTLIMKENECAYYVHCFAHQLQLALVAVAKNHIHIATLFNLLSNIVNVVGASCKHRNILKEKQAAKVIEALKNGEISSGQGLNQESTLIRASDTRWGSHYGTLLSLISLFSDVIDVLDVIV
ncbi:uncharacterized protein LOC130780676 [Actinidia eriantha]|uniref:uncharacterized protein LOC130780676 n=1 Tax=Actinidia eriantha TaxID=165200 RepID=UPI002587B697|nr:uncharacterized protein LOC130780676 [Actinidia eriantha]